MFKSKAFNFITAIGFFVVAVAMIVAAAFIYEQTDDTTATAPKSSPTVTTAPAPSTTASQKQAQAPRATQREARNKETPGLMKTASHWLNKTFGLHLLKEETKSMISLLCGFVGTFFSFRTFLLSRRRNQLLEQSLKQRSS